MRSKKLVLIIAFLMIISGYFIYTYFKPTELVGEEIHFSGIQPLQKDITNIFIIHGIGDHCIGYSDKLVSSIVSKFTNNDWSNANGSYFEYLRRYVAGQIISDGLKTAKEKNYKIYFPRNGGCEINEDDNDSVDYLKKVYKKYDFLINNSEMREIKEIHDDKYHPVKDYDLLVSAQDDLCRSFYDNKIKDNKKDFIIDCFRLSVDKNPELIEAPGEIPNYITGFVKQITVKHTATRKVKIFEITWSPSSRWIKDSFKLSEYLNSEVSNHWFNKKIKAQVVNSSIADAVAYLSDSNILVNLDIFKSFCLALNDSQSNNLSYDFKCEKKFLENVTDEFSEYNDMIFISHSLGTRAMFDTLGLLSDEYGKNGSLKIMESIFSKFKSIGAQIPEEYLKASTANDKGFSEVLAESIPRFIDALSKIYVFTNQIPLLEANITSPFKQKDYEFGHGFSKLVARRKDSLQIVAFHDPDDLLSYNLKCWFYQTILKDKNETKDILYSEAERLADKNGTNQGDEYRELLRIFFNICNKEELNNNEEYETIFESIWTEGKGNIDIKDATVRLRSRKIPLLFAFPGDIHSNYFYDQTIHKWLIEGKQ